jgi:ferritin-like metal-binding protein YciE
VQPIPQKGKSANEALARYLEDAIAAESSFETQLCSSSDEVEDLTVKALFRERAEETKQQYTSLTQRWEELGGSTSGELKTPLPGSTER